MLDLCKLKLYDPLIMTMFCVQTWGSVQEGVSCPDVQSFLSSVDRFVLNLSSARVSTDRKFQLQQVDLPEAIGRLSSPADYTAAGRKGSRSRSRSLMFYLFLRPASQL